MNIIEAFKSGKPFKRSDEEYFYLAGTTENYTNPMGTLFAYDDILAEDWEIEGEKRELSWPQLFEAIESTTRQTQGYSVMDMSTVRILRKQLGFTEDL